MHGGLVLRADSHGKTGPFGMHVLALGSDGLVRRVWSATGGSTALVRGINAVAALAATSLLARLLSATDFGLFVLAQVAINGLSLLAARGRDQLAVREMAVGGHQSTEITSNYLDWAARSVLRNGTFLAAVGVLIAGLTGQATPFVLLVITTIPVLALTRFFRGVAQAMDRTAIGVFHELTTISLSLAVLGLAYLTLDAPLGLVPVHLTYLVAAAVSLLSLVSTLRAIPTVSGFAIANDASVRWRRSGDALALTAVMFFGLAYLETFVLAQIAGAVTVGAYAIANRLAVMLSLAALPVAMVRGPRLARRIEAGDRSEARAEAHQILLVTTFVALPFVAVLGVFADSAVSLLGGAELSEFSDLGLVLRLLLPAQLFGSVAIAASVCLTMYKRESTVARATVFAVVLQLLAAVVFIGQFELIGAVISRIVGGCVLLVTLLRVLVKEIDAS